MSRETLEGEAAAGDPAVDAPPSRHAPVLLPLDEQGPQDPPDPPEPQRRSEQGGPRSPGGRTLRLLRTAVAVLVVAVLAGSLGVLVEQRRATTVAADGVRLVGVFLHDGLSRGQGVSDMGTAAVTGHLQLVNGGTDGVEVVGASVAGIPLELLEPPDTVAAGQTGRLRAALDLPCSGIPRERVLVDLRVQSANGSGRVQRVEVEPLRLPSYLGLAELLPIACSGDLLVHVSRMEMDDAGLVLLRLRSDSPRPTEVRLSVSPLMGAQVNGSASVATVVPAGGSSDLRVEVGIVDCARAREALGSSYELLRVEADIDGGPPLAYLDGWQPGVATAAFGFALARQCR